MFNRGKIFKKNRKNFDQKAQKVLCGVLQVPKPLESTMNNAGGSLNPNQ